MYLVYWYVVADSKEKVRYVYIIWLFLYAFVQNKSTVMSPATQSPGQTYLKSFCTSAADAML